MEITGKIVQILPKVTGTGKSGNNWQKQEFIIEQPGTYPKKVMVALWGDKIDQFNLQNGEEVTASVDVESREYNGRWYTDVKAWNVQKKSAAASGASGAPAPQLSAEEVDSLLSDDDFSSGGGGSDDLPF